MTQTARISLALDIAQTGTADLATITAAIRKTYPTELLSGTGSGNADMVWSDTRTLAASGSEDLDLAGSLTGHLGGTLTFVTVKAVIVKAAAGNTNDVVVSRPASNGVPLFAAGSDAIPVKPGGLFAWVAPGTGVTVTAGTGDLLHVANSGSGTGVDYDVIIVGTSA